MSEQKRTAGRALGGFLGFIGMSAVAGVLVAAAVTPAIALTGVAANGTIDMFENLPNYLEITDLAESSNIYALNGEGEQVHLATFYDQNRQSVGWDQVSQFAKDAAVSGEDPRFYEHGGVDLQGTVAATIGYLVPGGNVRGGSSITQQYVKNVLIETNMSKATTEEDKQAAYEEATKESPDRKLKEMRYAITLEKSYSKDEILLGYLNIALFGGRVYGIQAAAEYYFGVSAAELNIEQSAALLAIVNNPDNLRLDRPDSEENGAANGYAKTLERRNYIIDKMLQHDKITQEQYDVAYNTPITPNIVQPSTGCQTAGGSAYFCDYVTKIIENDPAFGATEDDRMALLRQGGMEIITTLDLDLQVASENAIANYVPFSAEGIDVGGVMVSVEPGTGKVLAMAQNKIYSQDSEVLEQNPDHSAINYNTDFEYGGSLGFQPGSTYKVFTVGEWLKEGHSLNESIDGRKRSDWGSFRASCAPGGTESYPGYAPGNDEGGNGGTYTALSATTSSVNTGFIAMAKQLDLCGIKTTAESFGVHRANGDPLGYSASTVLGTEEIAPLTMANAFASIAANGVVCKPNAIASITHRDGTPVTLKDGSELKIPNGDCAQAVAPEVTSGMAYAMQKVMSGGTGSSSANRVDTWVPMIGKTGTTDDNEATWMSGASTKVATVAGVFNTSGHVNLRRTYFNDTQAAVLRHYMWPAVMSVANAKYGGDAFPEPPTSALKTVYAAVPDVRGKSLDEARRLIEGAGFGFEDGGPADSELPAGQVSGTNPAGEAPRGSVVSVNTSNGQMVLLPNVVGKSFDEARNSLGGFNVSKSEQSVTDKKQDGKVISSDPAAGSPVKSGQNVTLTVGKFEDKGNNGNNGNGNGTGEGNN
ncbi:transglycosylase domain-containing protein [Microterricola pindariensis]|uniref:PASTA domain-containing protein n=1 Tax=Microterricola pindariensis TaxID=478010 RepID=A0ABX5AWW1_9MICO|nr:transglycosylase domain-containing protein [Microterricola pindariensis]PPL19392.1 hypothetical protein GY24_06140 [Microterricola pindariensis]